MEASPINQENQRFIQITFLSENALDRVVLGEMLEGMEDMGLNTEESLDPLGSFGKLGHVGQLSQLADRIGSRPCDVLMLGLEEFSAEQLTAMLEPIRRQFPGLPVVLLAEASLAMDGIRYGADDCLRRNAITPGLLDHSIRAAIARKSRIRLSKSRKHSEEEADKAVTSEPPGCKEEDLKESLVQEYQSVQAEGRISSPVTYELVEKMGAGLQGAVYRAVRHGARGCETLHAVKLFNPASYRRAADYWADMERIATQVSELQHHTFNHLLQQHTYNEARGIGYVEMELVRGLSLAGLLSPAYQCQARSLISGEEWERFGKPLFREGLEGRTAFQPGAAVYVIRQALLGVEGLHDIGYVHLDLKPDNLMMDETGFTKVVDFGRAVQPGEQVKRLLCSPFFVAPELGPGRCASASNDVFSLGLVLLYLLSGRLPFDSPTVAEGEWIGELRAQKERLPDELDKHLPADVRENELLSSLIRSMLHPDPEKRPVELELLTMGESSFAEIQRQLIRSYQDADYAVCFRHLYARAGTRIPDWKGGTETVKDDVAEWSEVMELEPTLLFSEEG